MTDFVWVGSSGVYANANQWRNADTGAGPPAGPPGLNDTGTIDNGGTASINGALAALGAGLLGGAGGGTIDVNTGGTFDVGNSPTSALLIGGQGAGAVNVAAGGQVQFSGALTPPDPAFVFGQAAGETGIADVQGVVDARGNPIVIGGAGSGSVTVHAGGTLRSGAPFGASFAALDLGQAAGGAGTLTVSDPNSFVFAQGLVDVGDAGTGTLTVENGSTFDGGFQGVGLAIGLQAGATGLATVESGATMDVNGPLEVGALGAGTLLVESGGTVGISGTRFAEVAAVIAAQPGSTGIVRVDGAGSVLGFGSGVQIGTGGTIAVTNGGSVDVAQQPSACRHRDRFRRCRIGRGDRAVQRSEPAGQRGGAHRPPVRHHRGRRDGCRQRDQQRHFAGDDRPGDHGQCGRHRSDRDRRCSGRH